MAEHGIGVTDAQKLTKIVEFCPIDQITFLKRNFKPFELCPETIKVAAIDWNSVVECVRWVHTDKNKTDTELLFQNIEASLYLAWGHGRTIFDKWKDELEYKLRKVNIRMIAITWDDITKQNYPDFSLEY